jgi:glutathione S-transferase
MLEEIGEPYELTILGDRASRLADPEHLARHPLGRVPVLEDGDVSIFESGAICLYLADKYPEKGLLPASGTVERGLAFQWVFFTYTELQAAVLRSFLARDDASAAQAARDDFVARVDVVDGALDQREYLVGDRFTVADLLVAGALGSAGRLEVELPQRARSYVERVSSRPAKQRSDARNPA